MNDPKEVYLNQAIISLGSNIDKERNLPAAVSMLRETGGVLDVSSVYETLPIGPSADVEWPRFWNAAVLMETTLDANSFRRQVLLKVEKALNRQRTTNRYAPRTIDADLILFNLEVINLDSLHHIPDPDLLLYAHVAIPVADIVPDMPHPETGERMRQIASRLVSEMEREKQPLPEKQTLDLSSI